jgi:hypothetical protein
MLFSDVIAVDYEKHMKHKNVYPHACCAHISHTSCRICWNSTIIKGNVYKDESTFSSLSPLLVDRFERRLVTHIPLEKTIFLAIVQ